MAADRFTLERGNWYGLTLYVGEGAGGSHPSPIRVDALETLPGQRSITLSFLHLAYAAGVQSKCYRLRTLKREATYFAAEQLDAVSGTATPRLVVIERLTPDWQTCRFPHTRANLDRLFDAAGAPRGEQLIELYGPTYG